MRGIRYTTQFKKDVERMKKRGKSFATFKQITEDLFNQEKLPPKFRDHALTGNLSAFRECHIEPDWLLMYQQTDEELVLVRMGSHADLFK